MKVIMYGTNACKDCVAAEALLKEAGIRYLYLEWSDNIGYLKRFLTLRDENPLFDETKKSHSVGIPCFQFEDGTLTLDVEAVLNKAKEEAK